MPTLPALTTQPSPAPVWAGTATPVADIVRPTDPEISQGWPLTAIPPSRQRFNWVLNRLSAGLRYIEQHGIGKWQVEEDYGEDSIVVHDHKLWVAKRGNKGKIPPDNADDWDGIASMIAGPGGVDLTTIINQLIAADVTLNSVDVDLQSQIDALGGAIGDIDIPPPPDPIDWTKVPSIENAGGLGNPIEGGVMVTFPSLFRIRSREYGYAVSVEDIGGGRSRVTQKLTYLEAQGYGVNSSIVVAPVFNGNGVAPPGGAYAYAYTGAGMEMFICLECPTVDVGGWSVNWVAMSKA